MGREKLRRETQIHLLRAVIKLLNPTGGGKRMAPAFNLTDSKERDYGDITLHPRGAVPSAVHNACI